MTECLMDTNDLIHIHAGDLPDQTYSIVHDIWNQSFLISIISEIERPEWRNRTHDRLLKARNLLKEAEIISVTEP